MHFRATNVDPRKPLRLNILGKTAGRVGDREIVLSGRKCRALLGCLALSEAGEETRELLIGLLWSETDEERARASLRQAIYDTRLALERAGFDGLHASKFAVAIDRSRLDVDLWAVIEAAKAGHTHPLLLETERLTDTLLAELESIDSAFRVWLLAKRQTIHDRLVHYLEEALHDDHKPHDAATDLARALLNLDPTHEEAARALMRLRAEAGDVGGALSVYKRLWDLLDEEYDVEPSKETQDLVAAIKLAQPDSSQGPEAATPTGREPVAAPAILTLERRLIPPRPPKLIVAVGGFDASGIALDRTYLVQGFRRELIANLVRFREWAVRDSARGSGEPASTAIGEEYLVEASALQGSRDMRLVVTLRDTGAQEYVWSDQYRLTLDDWVDAQQHLVQRIARALNVYISAGRLTLVKHHPDPQLRAYDRWLFGQTKTNAWDPAAFHEATAIFEQIIAETPDFSPAYSTLAQLQNSVHFIHPGVYRSTQRTEQALAYAQEASRLDPVDSRGQLSLGWAHAMARHHDLAEMHHELAVDLNENDPWTVTSVALGFATRGQLGQAREAAERALALSPDLGPNHWGYHQQIRFMSGDYEGSVLASEPASDVIPTSPAWKIAALGHLGHRGDAQAEARRYLERIRGKWFGSEPASSENIARWTLHCFPIKRSADWQHFRDGLAESGLPVSGLTHNAW